MSQQTAPPPIPAPSPQPESDFYFEKCREGELWLRHCRRCDGMYFYPRDICPECFSKDTDWVQSSGRGIIHTFAIVHRGPTPPFRDRAPYVPVIVELDEGPRMPANLIGCEPDPSVIKVGMAVEVVFEPLNDSITLPYFRPAG